MHGIENADVPVGLIIIVPLLLVGVVADTLVFGFIDFVFGGNPGEVGVGQAVGFAALHRRDDPNWVRLVILDFRWTIEDWN